MAQVPCPSKRTTNSWMKSYQSVWEEQALDYENFPEWYRVWCLAVARGQQNGHSGFPPGEIARRLGRPDSQGGWIPKAPSGVSQAISSAKRKGLLDRDSNSRCLVLPNHAWSGGLGSPFKICPVHG